MSRVSRINCIVSLSFTFQTADTRFPFLCFKLGFSWSSTWFNWDPRWCTIRPTSLSGGLPTGSPCLLSAASVGLYLGVGLPTGRAWLLSWDGWDWRRRYVLLGWNTSGSYKVGLPTGREGPDWFSTIFKFNNKLHFQLFWTTVWLLTLCRHCLSLFWWHHQVLPSYSKSLKPMTKTAQDVCSASGFVITRLEVEIQFEISWKPVVTLHMCIVLCLLMTPSSEKGPQKILALQFLALLQLFHCYLPISNRTSLHTWGVQ